MRKIHARNFWIAFGVAMAILLPVIQAALHVGLSQQALFAEFVQWR